MPELEGVAHEDVEAGDVRLHVAEAGTGLPLVLLHGWPQNWWLWRKVIPGLAERHRVICPDFRGYGWSEAPPSGYEKERWAEDVLALMDAMGIGEFGVIGHDWGGVVGFRLCLRRPDRVTGFLALGTGHPYMPFNLGTLLNAWRISYQLVLAAPVAGAFLMERAVRLIGTRERVWDAEDTEVFASQFSEPARANAAVLTYRTFLTKELARNARAAAEPLETPTLMLQGEHDPVVRPSMLGGYEEHAPHMTTEVLPGVGHWVPEQVPELVVERALQHFAG
jgi:pimeloyl-ACP methyl ester carboxylesterase